MMELQEIRHRYTDIKDLLYDKKLFQNSLEEFVQEQGFLIH